MPKLHLRAVNEDSHATIDWSATQAFASHRGGRVWINLKGREPNGIVPENNYSAVRDQVRDILLNATDAVTGQRIIRAVHNREDIYRGPYAERVSDLLIEWDYSAVKDSLICSFDGRSITINPHKNERGNQWKGSHRPEGIFIAAGPHIKPECHISDANIYDIAPTVLYLQGLAIPSDMDGKVLAEMFDEDHISAYPVRRCEPAKPDEQAIAGLSAEEAIEMEKRLRDLGYIE
jgi:predicted AlkP superfamily phosphohydrolase/phosphomutase